VQKERRRFPFVWSDSPTHRSRSTVQPNPMINNDSSTILVEKRCDTVFFQVILTANAQTDLEILVKRKEEE